MKKILALIIAVVMVFSICACSKDGGKEKDSSPAMSAIERYYKAIENGDGEALMAVEAHPYILDYEDEDYLLEEYTEEAEDERYDLEDYYGDGIRITVKEKETTSYKKKHIDRINEYLAYEEDYPDDYLSGLEIIEVEVTIKGSEKSETDTIEHMVIEVDGKWYATTLPGVYSKTSIENIYENWM